jgi:hypothetical protein
MKEYEALDVGTIVFYEYDYGPVMLAKITNSAALIVDIDERVEFWEPGYIMNLDSEMLHTFGNTGFEVAHKWIQNCFKVD